MSKILLGKDLAKLVGKTFTIVSIDNTNEYVDEIQLKTDDGDFYSIQTFLYGDDGEEEALMTLWWVGESR